MVNTFYDLYLKMDGDYANRIALRWVAADGKTVCSRTFGEYCADIRRFAGLLKERLGDPSRKHIAILSVNRYDFYVSIFACFLTGCVFAPLNYQKKTEELLDEIKRADVSAVFYASDTLDFFPELPEKFMGAFIDIFEYNRYPESKINKSESSSSLASILYTSGTTGHSKGVMLSQENLLAAFRQWAYVENKRFHNKFPNEDHSYFNALPLFHVGGLMAIESFLSGSSINICESPRYFYRDMAMMPSFYSALVPTLFSSICKEVKTGHQDRFSTLRHILTVGANADREAISCLIENGYHIQQGYAMTESFGCGTLNNSQDVNRINSVGMRQDVVQIKLDDGEICLKGKTIFMGYYHDPEETAKAFDADGWFHTGDLARVDEDGYYYLTGRKKNLIILSNGENVSPEELEAQVAKNEAVIEVLVKEKNDKICAEIFCEEGDRDGIRAFITKLNRTLPIYKRMTAVEFRSEPFPRTATGKIKRT